MSFFDSRWIDRPDHVAELPGGLPRGFRAASGRAGIKPSGKPDVGLLVCDRADATSAARFTRSGVLAAPVLLTQERCRLEGLRAVVANSGNANAATGRRGLDAATKMQGAAAVAGGVAAERVAVCSTGVIDVRDTNYCRISWHQDPRTGRIIVFSAIDNLWKGAASQAVQNLNLMFDRPETEGLL